MLLRWNEQDPVSQKEIDRNNAIYGDFQHNRNPFIDHPEYARMIWDPTWNTLPESQSAGTLFPNPVERGQTLRVSGDAYPFDALLLCDLCGRALLRAESDPLGAITLTLPSDLVSGTYVVKLMRDNAVVRYEKLIVR